jgi:hypothetical protein
MKPLDNKHKQHPSPAVIMSMEESISLEETNKIRISLGLKPLTDDKAPVDDKEKQAEENYTKARERESKDRESKYALHSVPARYHADHLLSHVPGGSKTA